MKPFLQIDRTLDDSNRYPNGAEFNTADVSQETFEERNALSREQMEYEKKLRIPKVLLILNTFCLVLAFSTVMYIAPYVFKPVNITEENAFGIFVAFLLFATGLAGFFILKKVITDRRKNVTESKEFKELTKRANLLADKTRKELKIPENAILADMLFCHYKEKNGIRIPISEDKRKSPYINVNYYFYIEDNFLCIATALDKFAVSLDSFTKITKVNEYIKIPYWIKPEPFNSKKYESYNISVEGNELLIDSYYILHFTHNDEHWGLFFPCYELPVFEELTGLKAEN